MGMGADREVDILNAGGRKVPQHLVPLVILPGVDQDAFAAPLNQDTVPLADVDKVHPHLPAGRRVEDKAVRGIRFQLPEGRLDGLQKGPGRILEVVPPLLPAGPVEAVKRGRQSRI